MIRTPSTSSEPWAQRRFYKPLGCNLGDAAHLARGVFDVQLDRVGEINAAQAVALMVLACERTTSREQLCRDLSVGSDEFAAIVGSRKRSWVCHRRRPVGCYHHWG
jgi:hypothetical protein